MGLYRDYKKAQAAATFEERLSRLSPAEFRYAVDRAEIVLAEARRRGYEKPLSPVMRDNLDIGATFRVWESKKLEAERVHLREPYHHWKLGMPVRCTCHPGNLDPDCAVGKRLGVHAIGDECGADEGQT